VNQKYYFEVLDRPRKRVMRMEIADDWIFHHFDSPVQTALSLRDFLAKNCIPVLPKVPGSQDLSPCDFLLVTKIKIGSQGLSFSNS
jgi:hypothetical protein